MRNRGSRSVALIAALSLVAAVAPGLARSQGRPGAGCEPSFEATLGWVCSEPGLGYRVLLPGGGSVLTHGTDPQIEGKVNDPRYGLVKTKRPACVTKPDEQFHGQVLYAYPSDAKNRITNLAPRLRDMYSVINGIIRAEASKFGRRLDLRVLCSRGDVFVQAVKLPTAEAQTNFSSVMVDLRGLGFHDPLTKYYIWFDGAPGARQRGGGTANIATQDDGLNVDSRHARGPNFAVTWGSDPEASAGTMLHEIAHTQGAVSAQAPNGTGPPNGRGGGMHCNDGQDIMCYPDDAARTNYKPNVCSTTHFDCNYNDYFNPKPKKNSWLASHWNLGGPANRFMSGCAYNTALLTAATGRSQAEVDLDQALADAGVDVDPIGARTFSIKKACRGRTFALSSYDVDVLQAESTVLGLSGVFLEPWIDRVLDDARDVDVCFYQGARLLKCSMNPGGEMGKVPGKATKARVFLRTGANARYVFNVV